MDLPIGFRFCPSDRELLSYYLVKRLKGESTQFQIQDVDVYSIEPWSLFNDININDSDDDSDSDDDEATYSNNLTYVFTTIKKRHGNGSERISRTVTTPSSKNQVIGTWKDQKSHDIIDMVSKKIIGAKRMLSFMPAPSKQEDHDDEDNEGTSRKRKRKQIITNNNIIDQLDGISYIMHEYSMTGSSYVLCRIRRKIRKSRKMKNKKMRYSSSCWDDQGAEYDQQPLHGSRMPHEDDHHQIMTNTSVLLNHDQSLMLQQQQQHQDAEYNYQQIQGYRPQMMTNTSVLLNHDQSSMLQQQQQHQDAEHNYQQIQGCMPQMMMNTSVLDHEQSSMLQQQQPDQDAEYDQQQGRMPYDDHQQIMMNALVLDHEQSSMWQQQQPYQDAEDDQLLQERIPYDDRHQIMVNTSVLDHDQSLMWQQHQPDQDAEDDQLLQGRMAFGEMMNAPILVLDENESSMRKQQQPVQSEAGVTSGLPILTDDEEAGFAQSLEEDLLQDNTTSTSNGDEDKITGAGHEEVEEDLSNQQQQQQPPAPTSEREDSLSLSSIDFLSDDSPDFGTVYLPSLERFDDPLDRISLWSY